MIFFTDKHIALVGLPGSGKSTIGRQLARRWSLPFIDADAVIEQRLGSSIRDFFAQHGEESFRDVEQQVIAGLLGDKRQMVIATGGGAVLRPANRAELGAHAFVVYLSAAPEEIAKRLHGDTQRPLLQVHNPMQRLLDLHAQRGPLYEEVAGLVVNEAGRPAVQVAQNVLQQLERLQKQSEADGARHANKEN
ncbi:shikimate kinase [Comamonas composti]|uniref:shikimate kinase n=1 Tax=Comamonas composti TaxID=408558 RepID=UPI000412FA39|nr:shikimate kinase [Comamonas composti]